MKYFAVIVAGGSGKRLPSETPKQFLLLNGQPALFYSIRAFQQCRQQPEIIVVLPPDLIGYWSELCKKYNFKLTHTVVPGGNERFHSVKNGLASVDAAGIVAIHDGARPVVSTELIDNAFEAAEKYGNSIPALVPSESVRYDGESIDRNKVFLIQTPQVFEAKLIKNAYEQPYNESFTDDSTVFEKYGHALHFIEGEKSNIKITWPADLLLAEHYLKN